MKQFFYLIIILLNLTSNSYAHAQKLTLILDWFANANHAPLFIAQDKGFFKEQNLEVELIEPANPADPPKLVAAGKADLAISYQPVFLEQVDRGLPLRTIGTLIDKPLACLVVLNNGSIRSIQDLKGKKIGYSSGDVNSFILKIMLEKHGLKFNDVTLINVYYDLTQALLAKKIDAAIGMTRNVELIQLDLLHQPTLAFFPEKNGVPTYNELIFVAHSKSVNEAKFSHFLVAVKKGVAFLQKNPEHAWQEFVKNHPKMNNELNHRGWLLTAAYFSEQPDKLDQKQWQNFAKFMQYNGLITQRNKK